MSALQYIMHDVTATTRGVVAHGCNCQGVMGSGVAKHIRNRWSWVYDRYRHLVTTHLSQGGLTTDLLGLSQIVNVTHLQSPPNTLFVANMFTQDKYGKDGQVYAVPAAIEQALDASLLFCKGAGLPLYMPRVGCGLGGLKWDEDLAEIVVNLQQKHDVDIYVCDL